ncbi:hypothetical protein [Luteococcus sp. OSA5]|uniref:hypothetical protein n=1 Tax=Luteococcus sp. OSA5 TaxID=3401630 RepID=UPI003B42BC8D
MADKRKQVIVRMSPQLHEALARWAADDMRSLNGQIEMLLRDGLRRAGRLPKDLPESRRPGRPRKDED